MWQNRPNKWVLKDRKSFNRKRVEMERSIPHGQSMGAKDTRWGTVGPEEAELLQAMTDSEEWGTMWTVSGKQHNFIRWTINSHFPCTMQSGITKAEWILGKLTAVCSWGENNFPWHREESYVSKPNSLSLLHPSFFLLFFSFYIGVRLLLRVGKKCLWNTESCNKGIQRRRRGSGRGRKPTDRNWALVTCQAPPWVMPRYSVRKYCQDIERRAGKSRQIIRPKSL